MSAAFVLAGMLFVSLVVVSIFLWIGFAVVQAITPEKRPKQPPDTFICSHCGDGPWHNSWSTEFDPPLCPNCTGAY